MGIKIKLAGGKKVNAELNGYTVYTDQPLAAGGTGTAPSPYELFLASLGTCAGIYIVGFCDSRSLSSEGIEIEVHLVYSKITRKLDEIQLEIKVPDSFPEKYYESLVHTANLCAVKKTIENPPVFKTFTSVKN